MVSLTYAVEEPGLEPGATQLKPLRKLAFGIAVLEQRRPARWRRPEIMALGKPGWLLLRGCLAEF